MIRATNEVVAIAALALALGLASACGGDEATDDDEILDSTLTVQNDSSFTLVEIYLSPIDQEDWGSDLLGGDVLDPGDSLQIQGIECDVYDAMVIDELGAECVVESVDLCLDEALWSVSDEDLLACDFGA